MNPVNQHWQKLVENHPQGTIHQTLAFKNFCDLLPQRGKTWLITTADQTAGSVLVRYRLPKGYSWLYAPRGPLLDYQSPEKAQKQLQEIMNQIHTIARQEKAIFLRLDPPLEEDAPEVGLLQKTLHGLKFSPTAHGFQPQHTLILDLTAEPDQILAQMKPKGRYNIKLAAKKGVTIHISDSANSQQFSQDLHDYSQILQETTTRDGFSGHNLDYYKKMIETIAPNAKLYLAKNPQGKTIAAAIITYFKDTATYYYGVSSNQDRNLMAPYLLHWQAIQDAKTAGYTKYDFFGIAPPNSPKHPWHGVTEFKQKFGGTPRAYLPAYEKALKPILYLLYKLYKLVRK